MIKPGSLLPLTMTVCIVSDPRPASLQAWGLNLPPSRAVQAAQFHPHQVLPEQIGGGALQYIQGMLEGSRGPRLFWGLVPRWALVLPEALCP